jgi:hypothetical protein
MNAQPMPWHYDATEGRPDWSKIAGVQMAMERQAQNEIRRRNERKGARHG